MLTFICLWTVLAAAGLPVGAAILRLTVADEIDRAGDRFVVSLWLGVALISIVLLAVSLAAPLTATTGLLIVVVLAALTSSLRSTRDEMLALARALRARLLLSIAWLTGAAVYATQPVVLYDTGLYHFGAIRWLSEYGAVRGLALIQPRFGVASSWFALAAPFEWGPLSARTASLAGGFALLLGGAHALICASRCLARRARTSDRVLTYAAALLYPVALYWGVFASPSPDGPVAVLTLTSAWAIVAISESPFARTGDERQRVLDARIVPIVLSAFAVTIKTNALPLAVACALFYVAGVATRRARWRRTLFACIVALLFAAPVVAYQFVTSGCPVLPSSAICLPVPWGIGADEARLFHDTIIRAARWGVTIPSDAGSFDWLWRNWIFIGVTYTSTLLFASVAAAAAGIIIKSFTRARLIGHALAWTGFAGLAFVLMFRANILLMLTVVALALATRRRDFAAKAWLLLIGFSGVALLMCSAPSLRFGLGYAAILWACFAVRRDAPEHARALVAASTHSVVRGSAILTLLFVAAATLLAAYRFCPARFSFERRHLERIESVEGGEGFSVLLPPPLPRPHLARVRLNDIEFYKPTLGNQCWASPLPCTACIDETRDFFRVPADVMLRNPGRGLWAGFTHGSVRLNSPSSSDVIK